MISDLSCLICHRSSKKIPLKQSRPVCCRASEHNPSGNTTSRLHLFGCFYSKPQPGTHLQLQQGVCVDYLSLSRFDFFTTVAVCWARKKDWVACWVLRTFSLGQKFSILFESAAVRHRHDQLLLHHEQELEEARNPPWVELGPLPCTVVGILAYRTTVRQHARRICEEL